SAAREQLIVAASTDLSPAPAREVARILHVALKRSFCLRGVAHQENLAQVAAGAVEPSTGCAAESAYLVGARLHQISEVTVLLDGVDAALVSGAGDQPSRSVKRQGVNNVLARGPDLLGRSIRRKHVYIRARQAHAAGQ